LQLWETRGTWATELDYQQGYQAARLLQERLVTCPPFNIGNTYLAMGDSWSVGAESTANEDQTPGYPAYLYQLLRFYYPHLRYQNTGISGETTQTMIDDGQLTAALAFISSEQAAGRRIGLISISIGGNDMIKVFPPPIGTSADGNVILAQVRANLDTIYSSLQGACDAQIITTTYANLYVGFNFPGFGNLSDVWLPQLHAAIREKAAQYGVPVTPVDQLDVSDEPLMDSLFYVTRPYALWPPSDPVKNFDFHPRPDGHAYIAYEMLTALVRQQCMVLPSSDVAHTDGGGLANERVRYVFDGGGRSITTPINRVLDGGFYGSH
jgi:lysophospholipase L1-like esterase